ncbi:hypothetical protein KGM_203507B, partial [Danaus plexippus plexippus]
AFLDNQEQKDDQINKNICNDNVVWKELTLNVSDTSCILMLDLSIAGSIGRPSCPRGLSGSAHELTEAAAASVQSRRVTYLMWQNQTGLSSMTL